MPNEKSGRERREFDRYITDLKIEFQVAFDLETKIDFRVKEKDADQFSSQKHSAVSKNISAEGLCFCSSTRLSRGDRLLLDIYVPSADEPLRMEGDVMWSDPVYAQNEESAIYDSGVHLIAVRNESVRDSIFVDPTHHVAWSNVLESVFSNFKSAMTSRKKA